MTQAAGELVTSRDEMNRRYPDQWVVVVEEEWVDEGMSDLRSARVVAHDPDRRAALAAARAVTSRYPGFGCFFTGRAAVPAGGFLIP